MPRDKMGRVHRERASSAPWWSHRAAPPLPSHPSDELWQRLAEQLAELRGGRA